MALRYAGDRDGSQTALRRAIDLDPQNVTAARLFGYEHRYRKDDPEFTRVTGLLARADAFSDPAKVELYLTAAKAFEDAGELAAAFSLYARAGAIQKSLFPWSDEWVFRLIDFYRDALSRAAQERLRRRGYVAEEPVFVIGMPRSGTTLVEQILAAHSDVFGAGELKEVDHLIAGWPLGRGRLAVAGVPDLPERSLARRGEDYVRTLRALAGGKFKRVVDKRPGNFLWVGLLEVALPGSRFVHLRRHPVDVCLSAYRLFFGKEVPYSYDLKDLGRMYRAYDHLVRLWADLLPPERFMTLRYEDLVSDPRSWTERLLAFLGLPFQEDCLRFHESRRTVRTASALQVRRPIVSRPPGQWRACKPYIGSLLDEIGDLVVEYEGVFGRDGGTYPRRQGDA